MAELKLRTIDESEIDTVLAHDIEFEGRIEFSEPVLIKGSVSGEIVADADLYVAERASVQATIAAGRVSIKGAVVGDVDASQRVELFSGAHLTGNVRTPDLIVQSGSRLNGKCEMVEETS